MIFNLDLLDWFGNFINFLIFAFIAVNIINTECFDILQMSLSIIGLLASIFIQIISMIIKENMKKRG